MMKSLVIKQTDFSLNQKLYFHLKQFVNWVGNCQVMHKQRQQLAELSPEQLDDIGLTAEQARRESQRACYDQKGVSQ